VVEVFLSQASRPVTSWLLIVFIHSKMKWIKVLVGVTDNNRLHCYTATLVVPPQTLLSQDLNVHSLVVIHTWLHSPIEWGDFHVAKTEIDVYSCFALHISRTHSTSNAFGFPADD